MAENHSEHLTEDVVNGDFLRRLRKLIGRDCTYLGKRCGVIEVLGEDGILVLECRDGLPPIQTDQYGNAAYRSNEVLQVPIFGTDREELNEDLLDLLTCLGETRAGHTPAGP